MRSEDRLEVVHEWIAAFNRRDGDALVELAHPAVDYRPYLAVISGGAGSYRGHRGLRRYLRDLADAWSEYETQIHSLRPLGEHVLMDGRIRATGRSSGLEVDLEMSWLHSFQDGKYARLRTFFDPAAALAAAAGQT